MSAEEKEDGIFAQMSFFEHLEELRFRLIKSLIALFIAFIAAYFISDKIIELLSKPVAAAENSNLTLLAPTEGFMVRLKASFLAGLIIASPVIFFQFWKFVAPGLYAKEKKFVYPVAGWSVLLFALGAVFAYQVLPFAVKFFLSFSGEGVANAWSLSKYITFVTYLLLAFGLVFELPLVIFFAARMGLVTPEFLRKKRRHAIVLLLVLSALITPPDIFTQAVLALPLVVLYEISIYLAVIAVKKRKKAERE